ncbi:hypothetical protein TNCV_21381 [Trichonephila clavipes]|nr:hypothetical protein TNCV_21381 [Trichonephila clavipes]
MELTHVEQRANIKIAFLQGRNSPCDFDLILKIKEPIRGTREPMPAQVSSSSLDRRLKIRGQSPIRRGLVVVSGNRKCSVEGTTFGEIYRLK